MAAAVPSAITTSPFLATINEVGAAFARLDLDLLRQAVEAAGVRPNGGSVTKTDLLQKLQKAVLDTAIEILFAHLNQEDLQKAAEIQVWMLETSVKQNGLDTFLVKCSEDILRTYCNKRQLAASLAEELIMNAMHKTLQKFPLALLKSCCDEFKLPKSSQKDENVSRLMDHIFQLTPLEKFTQSQLPAAAALPASGTGSAAADPMDTELYCLCRMPQQGRFMIACDRCNEWFHGDCVGVREDQVDPNAPFFCPNCQPKMRKPSSTQPRASQNPRGKESSATPSSPSTGRKRELEGSSGSQPLAKRPAGEVDTLGKSSPASPTSQTPKASVAAFSSPPAATAPSLPRFEVLVEESGEQEKKVVVQAGTLEDLHKAILEQAKVAATATASLAVWDEHFKSFVSFSGPLDALPPQLRVRVLRKDAGEYPLTEERKAQLEKELADLRATNEQLRGDIPPAFICPITCELMKDPAVASDGYSYERAAIELWLNKPIHELVSPKTGQPLTHTRLYPNYALKELVSAHREKLTAGSLASSSQ